MEIFIVLSMDTGFFVEVEGVFSNYENAKNHLNFCSDEDEEKEFFIKKSILK